MLKTTETCEALLLDKRQVSALTGLSRQTIDRLTARGILKPLRPTGTRAVRFRRADVIRWVEEGCKMPRRC